MFQPVQPVIGSSYFFWLLPKAITSCKGSEIALFQFVLFPACFDSLLYSVVHVGGLLSYGGVQALLQMSYRRGCLIEGVSLFARPVLDSCKMAGLIILNKGLPRDHAKSN